MLGTIFPSQTSMPDALTTDEATMLAVTSCLAESHWREQKGSAAFQQWYFDALSDDGREALIVAFHDNYTFSPRYFHHCRKANGSVAVQRFPAISLIYCVDGKTVLSAVNEFSASDFCVLNERPGCSIAASSFRVEEASYGSGFIIDVELRTRGKRKIKAELEWLSIESDLSREATISHSTSWNIVAPRSDVSGRISLIGRSGKTRRLIHFRGTGYHDQFRSERTLEETVGSRFWARAHFVDSTVIVSHHKTKDRRPHWSKILLIRDGTMQQIDLTGFTDELVHGRYGLKLPERETTLSSNDLQLNIKPLSFIRSRSAGMKAVCEITMKLSSEPPKKTTGICEIVNPAQVRSWFFRTIANLQTVRL